MGIVSRGLVIVAIPSVLLATAGLKGQMPSQKSFPRLRGPYLGQPEPGIESIPFAEGILFPDHCSVAISPDGSEILWAEPVQLDAPRRLMSTRLESGFWTLPRVLPFSEQADGDCPVLSPDGQRLFFNSRRPIDGQERERVWMASRIDDNWMDVRPVPGVLNEDHLHWQISADSAGNLYFGTERPGGQGSEDIFMVSPFEPKRSRGASAVPGKVNTGSHETTPYVSPGGCFLIFSRSQVDEGFGGADLYVSFREEDGSWGMPRNLGPTVNSNRSECCPVVSPDGRFLFFLRLGMGYKQAFWVSTEVLPAESAVPTPTP